MNQAEEEERICPVCQNDYNNSCVPRFLGCHVVCLDCLTILLKQQQFKCPCCRRVLKKKDAGKFPIHEQALQQGNHKFCDLHQTVFDSYCRDEKVWFCNLCPHEVSHDCRTTAQIEEMRKEAIEGFEEAIREMTKAKGTRAKNIKRARSIFLEVMREKYYREHQALYVREIQEIARFENAYRKKLKGEADTVRLEEDKRSTVNKIKAIGTGFFLSVMETDPRAGIPPAEVSSEVLQLQRQIEFRDSHKLNLLLTSKLYHRFDTCSWEELHRAACFSIDRDGFLVVAPKPVRETDDDLQSENGLIKDGETTTNPAAATTITTSKKPQALPEDSCDCSNGLPTDGIEGFLRMQTKICLDLSKRKSFPEKTAILLAQVWGFPDQVTAIKLLFHPLVGDGQLRLHTKACAWTTHYQTIQSLEVNFQQCFQVSSFQLCSFLVRSALDLNLKDLKVSASGTQADDDFVSSVADVISKSLEMKGFVLSLDGCLRLGKRGIQTLVQSLRLPSFSGIETLSLSLCDVPQLDEKQFELLVCGLVGLTKLRRLILDVSGTHFSSANAEMLLNVLQPVMKELTALSFGFGGLELDTDFSSFFSRLSSLKELGCTLSNCRFSGPVFVSFCQALSKAFRRVDNASFKFNHPQLQGDNPEKHFQEGIQKLLAVSTNVISLDLDLRKSDFGAEAVVLAVEKLLCMRCLRELILDLRENSLPGEVETSLSPEIFKHPEGMKVCCLVDPVPLGCR